MEHTHPTHTTAANNAPTAPTTPAPSNPCPSADTHTDPPPSKPTAPAPKRKPLRTLADYNEHYRAKTGDTPIMPNGFTLAYLPERGWCQWRPDPEAKLLLIWSVSGDGRFWRDWARTTAALLGYRALVTICTRPIRAYIRFWHWQIDRTESREGKKRYHCRTEDGRRVLITHKHTDPDGQDAYWVTEYLTERNDTHG